MGQVLNGPGYVAEPAASATPAADLNEPLIEGAMIPILPDGTLQENWQYSGRFSSFSAADNLSNDLLAFAIDYAVNPILHGELRPIFELPDAGAAEDNLEAALFCLLYLFAAHQFTEIFGQERFFLKEEGKGA